MPIGPAGQRPGVAIADRDDPQVGRLGRALVPDHQLFPGAFGEADRRLIGIRLALEQPGRLPRCQVAQVKERAVPIRGRAAAPQVNGRAILECRFAAVRMHPDERRARVAVGIVLGKFEDDPVPLRRGQVALPGSQPPPVPVVLGEQQVIRSIQVHPAEAAMRNLERQRRLQVEWRGQAHDRVPMLGRSDRVAAVECLRPDQPGRCPLIPGDPPWADGHPHPRHLVTDRQVGDHPDQRSGRRPDLGPPGEVTVGHPEREWPLQPMHQQELPIRGLLEQLVQAGWPQLDRRASRRIHPQRDRRRQFLEPVLIGLGAEQVLEGCHLRLLA